MIAAQIAFAVLLLSVGLYGAAVAAYAALRRDRRGRRIPSFLPPVSVVKPLSGLDDDLEANLESFYRLEYPDFEVVFSLARRSDPAFPVARRIAERHPEVPTSFVLDAREPGGNSKVNRLSAGLTRARHRFVLMADGNVRVHPEFLVRAVSFFSDPGVGLVSHLFRARGAKSLGSRLESLHLNGALRAATAGMARILGMPCVVGKSILVSREALEAIGGIEVLRDHLAEDYLLGKMVARAGYRVVLSGDEIETAEVSRSLASAWSRQRRWAILRKRLGGSGYAAELLASPLPWLSSVLVASGARGPLAAAAVAVYLFRVVLEAASSARSGSRFSTADWLLVVARDAAVAALFWAGLFGRRTSWRGRMLEVGRLTFVRRSATDGGPGLARAARSGAADRARA